MTPLRSIFKTSSPLIISSFISSILVLLSTALLIKHLGLYDYGIYTACIALSMLFSAVINYQPFQASVFFWFKEENNNSQGRILILCSIIDLISASLACLLFYVTSSSLFSLTNIQFTHDADQVIVAVSVMIFFTQTGLPESIYRCFSKFFANALLKVLMALLKFISAVLSVYADLTLPESIIAFSILVSVGYLSQYIYSLYVVILNKRQLRFNSFDTLSYLKYCFWINIKILIEVPVTHLDRLLINAFLGPSSTSIFDIAKKLANMIGLVIRPLGNIFLPLSVKNLQKHTVRVIFYDALKNSILLLGIITLSSSFVFILALYTPYTEEYINKYDEYILAVGIFIFSQIILSSFIFVNILMSALGLIKAETLILFVINSVYLLAVLLTIERYQLLSISLAYLFQVTMLISYRIFFIYKKSLS